MAAGAPLQGGTHERKANEARRPRGRRDQDGLRRGVRRRRGPRPYGDPDAYACRDRSADGRVVRRPQHRRAGHRRLRPDLRRPRRRALRLHPADAQARVAGLWPSRRVRRRPRRAGGVRHGRERGLPWRGRLRLLQGPRGRRLRDHRHRCGRGRHVRRQAPSRHAAPRGRPHAGPYPSVRGGALHLSEPRELPRGARVRPRHRRALGKARG